MDQLLTQKDLSERWQVDIKTIERWRKEGIITPCKGIPSIRFSPQYIAELEGVKLERFSPLERRRLETENQELARQNEELKRIISDVLSVTAKAVNF
ncbi:hypothetical protein SAMN02745975_00565 [Geosporobacter subterraneus DSM 17957]|uniref:Histidine kinase n=1 Tax=Geosporobacter subterraneus DSM 17957 TaxID=1121919 RepID=A0A1M6DT88_9FIRM|nr:DNA-binding protein [Geosporobacter subterraneus]SHI76422.1 hypothetical protein SAMN02745975_00565 [Geosporobacter subterraneus DSM 17957]